MRFLKWHAGSKDLRDERNITNVWRGMGLGVLLGLFAWAVLYFLLRWLLS
jgi:hypothetical protein